jgi:outer membrane receptor protein involved in Fe transport
MRVLRLNSGYLAGAIFSVFTLLALAAPPAGAQTFRGTILGTVTDASGAAIAGATVTAKNQDTGVIRTSVSTSDGTYRVPELPIGMYTVSISIANFETAVTGNVKVDVAGESRVDVSLKPGAMTQQVQVQGETLPEIESTSDTIGGTLEAKTVTDLPVNGRDYTKLIYLVPGVAGSPDQISDSPGSYGTFSLNGARGRANNFLLDGTDMNDGFRNDPAINEAGVFGTPATILPVEAVQELRVLSNYEAEYGRNAGAVINIVTKSGSNAFHGSGLEFFRDAATGARNYFNFDNTPKAPFSNNQYGGSLGGPIVKDKTFFFADYEGQHENVGSVSEACVPDPAQIAADGGATNSVIAALLARNPWPAPNISGITSDDDGCPNGPNSSTVSPSYNHLSSAIAKIDHNFNANNILTGRYYFGDSVQSFPLALTGGGILPGFNTYTPTRVQLVSISYVRVVSPTQTNEARLGWNRFAEGFFPADQSFQPSSIGLDTGTGRANMGLPVIDVGDFSQLGASHSDPRDRVDTNWHFIDNYSWTLRKHDLKFGYEFRRTSISQFLGISFRGELDFNDLSDFLAGNVTDGGSQTAGNATRNSAQNSHGLYIQDSFHLSSRFTVNAGVRWDYMGIYHEKNDLLSNFDAFNNLVQVGSPTLPRLYNPDYKNFAPRLSVAWDPLGTGKTVLRAGYGIFFDSFSQDIFMDHLPYNSVFDPGPAYNPVGPATISSGSAVATIVSGQPVFPASGFAPTTDAFGVDRNIRTPYMENFNLNIQQQVVKKVVVQVGYVGSEGHKLFRFLDVNQPSQAQVYASDLANNITLESEGFSPSNPCIPDVSMIAGSPVTCVAGVNRANPLYFYINQEQASANSNYHSLQSSLRVNNWHNLDTSFSYVWSHSIDNASDSEDFEPNASQPNDSTRTDLERANSNFDIRNRFVWNFVYRLPTTQGSWQRLRNGWGINGIMNLQTGQPFQLNYNFEGDYSGSGEFFDRPDVVGPIKYNYRDPNNFLDLTSFAVPCTALPMSPNGTSLIVNEMGDTSEQMCTPGTRHFGSEGRDSLRAAPFKQFDFSIFKDTKITERVNLQLRLETYNLFNHPNFANPFLPEFIADAAQGGTDPATGLSQGHYALGATGDVGIGNPFLGSGGPRGMQIGAKVSF